MKLQPTNPEFTRFGFRQFTLEVGPWPPHPSSPYPPARPEHTARVASLDAELGNPETWAREAREASSKAEAASSRVLDDFGSICSYAAGDESRMPSWGD